MSYCQERHHAEQEVAAKEASSLKQASCHTNISHTQVSGRRAASQATAKALKMPLSREHIDRLRRQRNIPRSHPIRTLADIIAYEGGTLPEEGDTEGVAEMIGKYMGPYKWLNSVGYKR